MTPLFMRSRVTFATRNTPPLTVFARCIPNVEFRKFTSKSAVFVYRKGYTPLRLNRNMRTLFPDFLKFAVLKTLNVDRG
jgi:hypothetical protein